MPPFQTQKDLMRQIENTSAAAKRNKKGQRTNEEKIDALDVKLDILDQRVDDLELALDDLEQRVLALENA